MLYTGLDYHSSFSYIITMNDRGEILSQKKLPIKGEIVDCLKGFGEEDVGGYWGAPSCIGFMII